jgi:hypothetical protein
MINVQNANSYFAGHTLGKAWNEYSGAQKDAAILQARRELSALVLRPMRDDEPPYREGDAWRDEYAVYEQAVYLLLRDSLPVGGGELTPSLDEAKERPVPRSVCGRWSESAVNWLRDRIVRFPRIV